MEKRLMEVGLCQKGEEILPNGQISFAWKILARLGYPGRYSGRTQDGLHEFLIVDPATGNLLATGKGNSVEDAICEASIAARLLEQHEVA
ncbi:MAG: hypothetical protein C0616_05395 [Desulfuromonas sp.]|nr:MAG: hypothetical protein C0616_05395 [Desulfuromonas sp.]